MTLNALGLDPNRLWKGPWRWFSEDLLDCCVPLETVKKQGITVAEFKCLAKCNGANCSVIYANESSVEQFRKDVKSWIKGFDPANPKFLVVSFDRGTLGQTGSGHFSPIGGYDEKQDMLLVLDVARFKYPSYWVPLELLFKSLLPLDKVANKSRAYMFLKKRLNHQPLFCHLITPSWNQLLMSLKQGMQKVKQENQDELYSFLSNFEDHPVIAPLIGEEKSFNWQALKQEHQAAIHRLFAQVKETELFKELSLRYKQKHGKETLEEKQELRVMLYSILYFAMPAEYMKPNVLQEEANKYFELQAEVEAIRSQIESITELVCCSEQECCATLKVEAGEKKCAH
jgi:glutathione gamma-glutamylcysteinyltransferase